MKNDTPSAPTGIREVQAALETALEQVRKEIARQAYAERQLRGRSAQRAADARAEATAARAEATAARAEATAARGEATAAQAEATAAQAEATVARGEATAARAEAAVARAETAAGLIEISDLHRKLSGAVARLNLLQNSGIIGSIRHRLRFWRDARLIRRSGLFDAAWYLRRYPDVAECGIDPACDFLYTAVFLDRDPGPGFDSSWYLAQNPDVIGMNPLLHYILFGAKEGRRIRA